jgi:hypothetical protein
MNKINDPQDIVFHAGLGNAVRQVLAQKGTAEDLMSNVLFSTRWEEVTKVRGEEMIHKRISGENEAADNEEPDQPRHDLTLRGGKGYRQVRSKQQGVLGLLCRSGREAICQARRGA